MLNQRRFWSDNLQLSDNACNELMFWKSSLNGRPIRFSLGATRIVLSDARESGYGGCHEVELMVSGLNTNLHLVLHGESLGSYLSPFFIYC